MPDLGNPNFFKTFEGKYQFQGADGNTYTIMKSCTNDVIFMDNIKSDANRLIGTLPPELTPNKLITAAVWIGSHEVNWMDIQTDGKIYGKYANSFYYLNGWSFNLSGNYYR